MLAELFMLRLEAIRRNLGSSDLPIRMIPVVSDRVRFPQVQIQASFGETRVMSMSATKHSNLLPQSPTGSPR
jgi:hypothetical protein